MKMMNCSRSKSRRSTPWLGLLLALALAATAQAAPTLEELQVYVKQHPENVRAVYYLGRLHAERGNYAQSVRLFMHLLKRPRAPGSANDVSDKMRVQLFNRIGFAYFKSEDLTRAQKVWTIALKKYPDDEFARKGLAAIARKTGGRKPSPGGNSRTEQDVDKPPPPPPVSPAEAKKAFDEGIKLYDQAKAQLDAGNDNQAQGLFNDAREKLELALRGKHSEGETNYYLGMCYLKAYSDDSSQLEMARDHFEKAYALLPSDPKLTPDITFGLAATYGLLDGIDKEIEFYEKTIELKPTFAEAHFRASLAYDKTKDRRSDWSAKSFEHAKKAIKLDPNYKKRFQPMIRNSQVAKQVAGIIHEIIQKSEDSQIPDDEAAKYAEQIGKILGDNNIKSEMLGEESGGANTESLKEMIKDPGKRQRLRQFWDASSGGDPQKVQDMLDNASPQEKEQVQKILSSDAAKNKIQKYLGNTKLQEAINQQQE
ncbi:MAG: tetratricopeptide repeat protein [Candidatus Riflebacteria bacterium]|nr:tetratricopeptide repeat protein [Candidatus Riflebacteria bacterium]